MRTAPLKTLCGRAPEVSQQSETRRSFQMLLPVFQLALKTFALQTLALPCGEVDIADRQIGQGRRFSNAVRPIQRRHLAKKDAGRPCVEHDVMDGAHQYMPLRREANETHTEDRTVRQIEGLS